MILAWASPINLTSAGITLSRVLYYTVLIIIFFYYPLWLLAAQHVLSSVTALCSEGPMFRRSYVQKVLCSEGPLFRRSYVQKVLCSEGPMFRNICSEGPMFRKCG